MEFVGPLAGPAKAWMGDPQSYERILAAFYRGLFDAGLTADVVSPAQLPGDRGWSDAGRCSSSLGCTSPTTRLLERLRAVRRGRRAPRAHAAHRVRRRGGRRPSCGDARRAAGAGGRALPGVHEPASRRSRCPVTRPVLTGAATGWADGLDRRGRGRCSPRYEHPHLGEFAAVTTQRLRRGSGDLRRHRAGPRAGRPHWRGGSPTTSLPTEPWRSARPDSVTCTSSVTPEGHVLRFVHNWTWNEVDYVPADGYP